MNRVRATASRLVSLTLALAGSIAAGEIEAGTGLPLVPERRVRFTTHEGTWMSVDVSPDGKTIIFDLLGQLYLLPFEGGQAAPITSGLAFNAQPRFSPDGKSIVFTSDRDGWSNVWIGARDGTHLRQLTHLKPVRGMNEDPVFSPAWTPDGKAIAVVEDGLVAAVPAGDAVPIRKFRHLVLYPLDGGAPTPLTHLDPSGDDIKEGLEYRGPAFGPDPRYVYAARSYFDSHGAHKLWQVVRIDRSTKAVRMETSLAGELNAARPALSSDGRCLAYASAVERGTGWRVRDLATEREWWLAPQGGPRMVSGEPRDLVPGACFTPDGKFLVASVEGRLWRIAVADGARTEIPFSVEVDQPIGALTRFQYSIPDSSLTVRVLQHPQISPDGRWVVFTALDRLWIADLPRPDEITQGKELRVVPRRLTQSNLGEFFPTWSPDSRSVAYATWSDAQGGAIHRLAMDRGGEPIRLTAEPAAYSRPLFTADGSQLIAVKGSRRDFETAATSIKYNGQRQLVALPAGGGPDRVIADYGIPSFPVNRKAHYELPQRVGDRLLLYEAEKGLWSMRPDGSDRRQLLAQGVTRWAGMRMPVYEVLVSPSGRFALTLADWSRLPYLIRMPGPAGSLPATLLVNDPSTGRGDARVTPLWPTGVDFLGWTTDERPYFSAGNQLYIARTPSGGETASPPVFDGITIDLEVPRDRAEGVLWLHDARLLTMRGTEVIEHGDLVVTDGRIAAVGRVGEVAVPPAATQINLAGTTIMPGLVDVHDHVMQLMEAGVHTTQVPSLLATLAYGITTLRDPQAAGIEVQAYGERAAVGDLRAPRIFTTNESIESASFGDGSTASLNYVRGLLHRWSEYYHSETIKQYNAGARRVRQLIVMAAREQGLTPTNEGGGQNLKHDLTLAFDGYGAREHSSFTDFHEDVIQFFARADTIDTPTMGVSTGYRYFHLHEDLPSDPKLRRFLPPDFLGHWRDWRGLNGFNVAPDDDALGEFSRQASAVVAAGGRVAMGSHGDWPGVGSHWEMWFLAHGGMPLYEVLRSATLTSAVAIGHERDLGSLEPGKLADLLILEKNPLDDIANTRSLRQVMKDGRLYDAGTLDEVWPRHHKLERQWWLEGKAP